MKKKSARRTSRVDGLLACTALFLICPISVGNCAAQNAEEPRLTESLPTAPQPQGGQTPDRSLKGADTQLTLLRNYPGQNPPQANPSAQSQAIEPPSARAGTMRLTRVQAEQLALKNNPKISAARLLALAQHQVSRESRAAELPN